MKDSIAQLYEYNVWANEQIFTRLEQLPEHVYDAELQSVFPSISKVHAHVYQVDRIWLAVLEEKSNETIFASIATWSQEAQGKKAAEMRRLFAEVAGQYRALLERTPDLDKAMTIEHPQYGRLETRFSELVQHVVNHGTYHRGHIVAMLRQLGHPGIATDYVFYLKERQG